MPIFFEVRTFGHDLRDEDRLFTWLTNEQAWHTRAVLDLPDPNTEMVDVFEDCDGEMVMWQCPVGMLEILDEC